jgi:tight adherence protein C
VIALALGAAWGGVAVLVVLPARPGPRRVRSVLPGGERRPRPRPLASLLEAAGRLVLRVAHRPPVGPERARLVGATAVAALGALALAPVLAPAVVIAGWAYPSVQARRAERHRLGRLEADLPQAVDLIALAVGAGLNVSLAVAAAGRRGTGPVAAELRRVSAEVARGRRLADALDALPARAGETVRPLASALAACERYGAPLGPALERIVVDVRRQRQRRAEEAARKVPVALLFPLVLCVLPAFALLTVAPLVAGALRELRL